MSWGGDYKLRKGLETRFEKIGRNLKHFCV